MSNMTFGVNLIPKTNNTYTLGDSTKKWNLHVNQINGVTYVAPLNNIIITTTNASASDALTYNSSITLQEGQLVFVILNSAMAGNVNATLQFGSDSAISLYITNTKQLKAAYEANSVLAFAYINNKLIMINPPVAI